MKKLLLVLLAVAVSTTLGGAVLGVLAAEDYIRVVGGGSQPIGPTFTIDIDVFTDEQTFCAYQHELQYDPTKVQVDSVTLQESGHFPPYFCSSLIDNVVGTVTSTCARLGCGPGAFSGTDQVVMHCIDDGATPLVLVPGSTIMRDNLNQPIAITRYDGSVTCEEEAVGGVVEMQVHGSDSAARVAGDSGPSFPFYAALAGAAAAVAIAGGALYSKRRWLR
jgi:hypothetical protein